MKNKKAFSLIELSVVILIISIVLAMVIKSSRSVNSSRISNAISITRASPVAQIDNLALWLEPVMEESFSYKESTDGGQLSIWNDINSQNSFKYYALRTASSDVTYKVNGIGGLPSVSFSGNNGVYFTLSRSASINDKTVLPLNKNMFTFFMVSKLDPSVTSSDTADRFAFYNGTSSGDGFGYYRTSGNKRSIFSGGVGGYLTSGSATTSAEIISGTYDGSSSTAYLYTNGIVESWASGSYSAFIKPTVAFYIGNTKYSSDGVQPWKGLISELIIFDEVISNDDRKEIEKYLGKKYGIKVSG